MLQNHCEIRVLVKGRPVTEYSHQGQTFVEGRAGSEFDIEFTNHTNDAVLAVLSVDGLSVLDGKEAGPASSGYAVDARQTLKIPGWTLSNSEVAKFVFSGKKESYVAKIGGDTRNSGVIGVLAYARQGAFPWYLQAGQGSVSNNVPFFGHQSSGALHASDITRNYSGNSMFPTGNMSSAVGSTLQSPGVNIYVTDNSYYSGPKGMASSASAGGSSSRKSLRSRRVNLDEATATTQNLGTEFGQATEFKTTVTEFTRGDLLTMIVMYYDDARGLKHRGIQIERPSRQRYRKSAPQPFPGLTGCTPPPDWS